MDWFMQWLWFFDFNLCINFSNWWILNCNPTFCCPWNIMRTHLLLPWFSLSLPLSLLCRITQARIALSGWQQSLLIALISTRHNNVQYWKRIKMCLCVMLEEYHLKFENSTELKNSMPCCLTKLRRWEICSKGNLFKVCIYVFFLKDITISLIWTPIIKWCGLS